MHQLNTEFNGQLDLIQVFKGDYHRLFMLQLISNDMDRMDYLKRDSFLFRCRRECKLRTIDSNDECRG
jgi:HD superfamily phosphohydrolase